MAIPGSRSGRTGEGRGYPRPSRPPNSSDNSDRFRERERSEGGDNYNNDASYPRRPVAPRPALAVPVTPAPTQPAGSNASNQFVLTDDLRELLKLVSASDLTEVSLENAGWKIQIKREKQAVIEYVTPPPASSPTRAGHASQAAAPGLAAAPAPTAEDNYHKVTAPMVGIFYRSPDPKARPFVQEGEMVEKGQTIGIIEAMKIMNEIISEHSGRCVRLNVENGQPVEYGQTLFLLEPV